MAFSEGVAMGASRSGFRRRDPRRVLQRIGIGIVASSLTLFGLAVPAGATAATSTAKATWSQSIPTQPPGSALPMMVYDGHTQTTILFGGIPDVQGAETPRNDTWSWDGTSWTQLHPAASPTPRIGATMAYDADTQTIILFGGSTVLGGAALADTWSWDGSTWSELSPATSPPPRALAAMAYDATTHTVVLFGGSDSGVSRSDTWLWDGTDWSASLASGPVARELATMAFDSASGHVLLFGGSGAGGFLYDTWSWDGSTWTQVATDVDGLTSGLLFGQISNNAGIGSVVMVSPSFAGNVLFVWTGSAWSLSGLAPTTLNVLFGLAFDSTRGDLVLFGGALGLATNSSETWVLNGGSSWRLASTPSPSTRSGAAMAYDAATSSTVLFGGLSGQVTGETWSWNGTSWSQLNPATSPPARTEASMVYDPIHHVLVLFGGVDNSSNYFNDTWVFDGTTWTQVTTVGGPSARSGVAMAFDDAEGVTVLFGGHTGSGVLNDVWTFDGTTWTAHPSVSSPPARGYASLAYDPTSKSVVLFGGSLGITSDYRNDTWTWSASVGWSQLTPATSPSPRGAVTTYYDPTSRSIVLFGGRSGESTYLNDTWVFDGKSWMQATSASTPAPRGYYSVSYDPTSHLATYFGGTSFFGAPSSGITYNDTWTQSAEITTTPATTPAILAATGFSGVPLILGAAALMLLGGSVVVARRRRAGD